MKIDGQLTITFTKREIEEYGLVEGDIINLEDMFIQKKIKRGYGCTYGFQVNL